MSGHLNFLREWHQIRPLTRSYDMFGLLCGSFQVPLLNSPSKERFLNTWYWIGRDLLDIDYRFTNDVRDIIYSFYYCYAWTKLKTTYTRFIDLRGKQTQKVYRLVFLCQEYQCLRFYWSASILKWILDLVKYTVLFVKSHLHL